MSSMPLLEYLLKGVKREQAKQNPESTRSRLPITPAILRSLRSELDKNPTKWDCIMLWAACCTCFFGFLRSGEITVPSQNDYDSSAHLSHGDVAFDSMHNPTLAQIKIKASKTDPFRKGVTICVGRTNNDLCPVAALAAYTTLRGSNEGPFFVLENRAPLTRERFVRMTKEKWQGLTQLDTQDTASELERLQRHRRMEWMTHLFKPWVGGRVQLTFCIYEFHEKNWLI